MEEPPSRLLDGVRRGFGNLRNVKMRGREVEGIAGGVEVGGWVTQKVGRLTFGSGGPIRWGFSSS